MTVFRRATEADIPFLLECRNDPETRRQSRHGEVKDGRWAAATLAEAGRTVYVLEGPKGPVGTGDLREGDYGQVLEVSLTVHPGARRQGWGACLLALLVREAEGRNLPAAGSAFIRPGNIPSLRLFLRQGFLPVGFSEAEGLLECLIPRDQR